MRLVLLLQPCPQHMQVEFSEYIKLALEGHEKGHSVVHMCHLQGINLSGSPKYDAAIYRSLIFTHACDAIYRSQILP